MEVVTSFNPDDYSNKSSYCLVSHSFRLLEYCIPFVQFHSFIPDVVNKIKEIIQHFFADQTETAASHPIGSNSIQEMAFALVKAATKKQNIGMYSPMFPQCFSKFLYTLVFYFYLIQLNKMDLLIFESDHYFYRRYFTPLRLCP